MKNLLKPVLICLVAGLTLSSCMKGKDPDYAGNALYMTLNVDGSNFYFTDDAGKTYFPGDVSRFEYATEYEDKDENTVSKAGNRVIVAFNFLDEAVPGFDYNIAIYDVVDMLNLDTATLESGKNPDEVYGDNPVQIAIAIINGRWLDAYCGFMSVSGAEYEITLLDNRSADIPDDMPADYQYLELRLKLDKEEYPDIPMQGYISFDLGAYAPSVTGKKGLYIRYKNSYGTVQYRQIEYKVQSETAVPLKVVSDSNM
jgi:hypothetical protein